MTRAAAPSGPPRPSRLRTLAPLVGLLVFVLALMAIRKELEAHSYQEILRIVGGMGARPVGWALALTLLSYFVLSGYDILAVRATGSSLPYHRVALASFLGYAFSQALGFSLFTGVPVRFRLYSSWGLSSSDIARVVAFYTFTFWLGLAGVAGVVFLLEPGVAAEVLRLGRFLPQLLGGTLLAGVIAYVVWARLARSPLRIRSFELPRPTARVALAQLAVGAADWTVAGLVLFVLLPQGSGLSLPLFLGAFVLAQTAGLLSAVPGGLGVFEAALLLLLPASVPNSWALGALVAYRIVYYLVPLTLAVLVLGMYEAALRREAVARATVALGAGATSVVPFLLSLAIFAAGGSLLVTGALPIPRAEVEWLAGFLPLSLIEASHFLGSVVGAWLLILAWGVQRRLDGAYHLTALLLGAGALLATAKGGGLFQAGGLLVLLLVLWASRREFFRRATLTSEPFTLAWGAAVAAVLLATVWLGFFAYKEVNYSGEMWWQFALTEHAPRSLRASVGGLAVVAVFALQRLLRPAQPEAETAPGEIPEEVPPLALACPRVQAHMALLGDKSFLLSESGNAFVMYAQKGRSWIALGDPVGEEEEYPELVWQFRNRVHRHDGWPVFFEVSPAFLPLYLDAGLTLLKVGEEGRVPLVSFSLEGSHRSELRQTVRRVEREGGSFQVIPREEVEPVLPELKAVSQAWLSEKTTREKGFSLGAFSEEYLRWSPVAVVRAEGRIVAFANILGAQGKVELAPDLMRYREEAPRGAMEYLFIQMMLWGSEKGYEWLSLGMAPLSGLETGPVASLWSRVGAAVFRHGEHFYNFQGLRSYKEKFQPVWEPRYLASPGGAALPFIFTNLSSLISGGIVGALKK
jgi:phosphatidylglycerol lysyltransferase